MRRVKSVLIVVLAVSAFLVNAEKNFLWKVTKGGKSAYMLGSIHLAKAELYPLNGNITKAFKESDILSVEANVLDNMAEASQKMMMAGMYANGDTIGKHVSSTTLSLIKKKAAEFGLPFQAVERMKPFLLSQTLSMMAMMKAGASPQHGLDMYFIKKAKQANMKVAELEGIDFQLKLFAELEKLSADKFLQYSLKELDNVGEQFETLFKAWKSGDVATMEKFVNKHMGQKEFASISKKLLDDRNFGMVDKVKDYMKSGKTYFVVAGAAHLVGNKGMVKLLQKEGYTVEQVGK